LVTDLVEALTAALGDTPTMPEESTSPDLVDRIVRVLDYWDIDEARTAAERLAQKRG
jgi:hypothetical protein